MKTLPELPQRHRNSNESSDYRSASPKPVAVNLVEAARMHLTQLEQQRVARRQSIAKLAQFALRLTAPSSSAATSHTANNGRYTPTSSHTNSPTPSFHSLFQYPLMPPSPLRQSPTASPTSAHHYRLYGVKDEEAALPIIKQLRSSDGHEPSTISATRKQLEISIESSPLSLLSLQARLQARNRSDSPSTRSPSSKLINSSSSTSSSTSSPSFPTHSLVSPISLSRNAQYDHLKRSQCQSPPPPPVNWPTTPRAPPQNVEDF